MQDDKICPMHDGSTRRAAKPRSTDFSLLSTSTTAIIIVRNYRQSEFGISMVQDAIEMAKHCTC